MLRGTLLDTGFQFFISQVRDAAGGKTAAAVEGAVDSSWGSFELHVRLLPLLHQRTTRRPWLWLHFVVCLGSGSIKGLCGKHMVVCVCSYTRCRSTCRPRCR